jgi:hypothetical protein
MILNFYTVSDNNIEAIINDPIKYTLLLRDEEAYMDCKLDIEDITVNLNQISSMDLQDNEGRLLDLYWANESALALQQTIGNYCLDAAATFSLIMHGKSETNLEWGWSKIGVTTSKELSESYNVLNSLPRNVISENFDFEKLKSNNLYRDSSIEDSEALILGFNQNLQDLLKEIKFCVDQKLGITSSLV